MDSPKPQSNDNHQNMASLEKRLEETTQQLCEKNIEHNELLKKYRQKKRDLLDKDDTIDALEDEANKKENEFEECKQRMQRSINDLNNQNQHLRNYVQSLSEGNNKLQLENYDLLSQNEHLNDHIRRLQSELQARSEVLKNLQSDNDNLKHDLSQKELQYEECKQKIEWFIGQEYLPGTILQIEYENEQAAKISQEEVEDDHRTQLELIVHSGHDEDQEGQGFQVLLQESIDQFQQWHDSGSEYLLEGEEEVAMEETLPVHSVHEPEGLEDQECILYQDEPEVEATPVDTHDQRFKKQSLYRSNKFLDFSVEEDACLVDFIFNFEPEVKSLAGQNIWKLANKAIIKVDGNDRYDSCIRKRMQNILVYSLHCRKELTTDKHRRIAKLCYEQFFNIPQKVNVYMAAYDRERRNGFKTITTKTGDITKKEDFSVGEIDQIIDYMFNTCKPLPEFCDKYWLDLSSRLKNDTGSSRSMASLKSTFSNTFMFNLFKMKKLHTAEHRKIAVLAFKTYGRKWMNKLTEQYDKARLPDTTEEIQQMESLAWRKVWSNAQTVSLPKAYSVEEDNKLIELFFKDDVTTERKSVAYWTKISAEFAKHTNYSRRAEGLHTHFKNVLLPTLHTRTELNTPEHRMIAVEFYNLWLEPDMSKHHIQLYDDARPPIDADEQ